MQSLEQMLDQLDIKMRGINWDCPRQNWTEGHHINKRCLFVKVTKHLTMFIHMRLAISTSLYSLGIELS